ncbi:DUF6519 domain-containing protein [uncultured Nostoc sp.]|uniref:DUF6519 domain-containing protein n=1 Tax=uncultured Nostoc sp. TaxID=340711 RepID=UPI0035CAF411
MTSAESNSSAIAFTLEHLGKDKNSSLSAGDWVEIIDDDYVLGNSERQLIKIERGFNRANTCANVSCDGMPFGSSKNVFNHSYFAQA